MNKKYIQAQARKWVELDSRLSLDTCLSEAIMQQVIIDLDNRGKIPASRLVDKKVK